MLILVISFILSIFASLSFFAMHNKYKNKCDEEYFSTFGFIFGIISLVLLILGSMVSAKYVECQYKAKIINREFNTRYTTEEIFWAEDVLDKIREVKRQRIEINGNL